MEEESDYGAYPVPEMVRFLLKNLHFPLKNVDFLLKNVDFIIIKVNLPEAAVEVEVDTVGMDVFAVAVMPGKVARR